MLNSSGTDLNYADPRNLAVLRNAIEQEHSRLDAIAAEKNRELDEYNALMNRLDDLPKKLRHPIMVPFGSVGFMPGTIVRTNEVLMMVGDGYFVEKSCFEANETLKRRVPLFKKVLEDCAKEKKLISDQLQFAERFFSKDKENEEIEIKEEYDEEKEAEFRRKRMERVKASTSAAKPEEPKTEVDVMSRLDELEALEAENGELENEDEEEEEIKPPPGVSKEEFKRLLARLDEESSDDEEDSESEDEEKEDSKKKPTELDSDDLIESSGDENATPSPVIQEVASKALRKRSVTFASNIEVKHDIRAEDPASAVKTATELVPGRTDSILRNKDYVSPTDEAALAAMREAENRPRVLPGSQTAFLGTVIERQIEGPPQPEGCTSEPGTSSTAEPKRVSKFKRQRANH